MDNLGKAMTDNLVANCYAKGVKDGIGLTIGGIIAYRVTRYFIKAYIDYKVEEKAKEQA